MHVQSLWEQRKEKRSIRDLLERVRTYPLEDVEVLDAVRTDNLDSHQVPVRQSLAGTVYAPCAGGNTV